MNGKVNSLCRRGTRAGHRALLILVTVVLTAPCISCTDLVLAKYRDDAFIDQYRYALGEKYLTVDGLRMCYQEFGEGDTVVIVPGLGTSIDFWQLNIPPLAEHYHVLAVDPPGFGKSDKPDVDYDLPWICDRIVGFLDAKAVPRASFIGGSMGGHLALLIALHDPQRVEKLVIMGSSGAWPEPGILLDGALKTLWNDAVVADHMRRNWPHIFTMMCKHETPVTKRLLRYQMALRASAAGYADEGRASARALRNIFYASCRDQLAAIPAPTLLIWGESDRFHPFPDARYFREHLPDARLVVVQDSAHEVMLDQTETFNRLVLSFLQGGTQAIEDCPPLP